MIGNRWSMVVVGHFNIFLNHYFQFETALEYDNIVRWWNLTPSSANLFSKQKTKNKKIKRFNCVFKWFLCDFQLMKEIRNRIKCWVFHEHETRSQLSYLIPHLKTLLYVYMSTYDRRLKYVIICGPLLSADAPIVDVAQRSVLGVFLFYFFSFCLFLTPHWILRKVFWSENVYP